MMSPDNNPTFKTPPGKEGSSCGKKYNSSSKPKVQGQVINCPRCDSPNTKFCYYNNYSLSQPRHFCKTCRRYWTKGGALRNVPIGGGCRKNKKMNKPSDSNSRISTDDIHSNNSSTPSAHQIGGLKFFQGISPAMDFQLGGLNNFPGLQAPNNTTTGLFMNNHFSSYNEDLSSACGPAIISSSGFSLDPPGNSSNTFMGLSSFPVFAHKFQEMGSSSSFNSSPSLASSIESLSSINQDLHWKLQQQRLAMLYVGDDNNEKENNANSTTQHQNSSSGNVETLIVQKPQPILFQNLETDHQPTCGIDTTLSSRKDSGVCGTLATEWFFDNSLNPTPSTTSGSNVANNENNPSNWNSGFQAWSDLSHFTALP